MLESVPPTRRRWFRFGLRTLLVFTALVGLLMSWVAKERQQSAREQEIAAMLRSQGCLVLLEGPFDKWDSLQSSSHNTWWRRSARALVGERVIAVHARDKASIDIRPISELTNLQNLSLIGTSVQDLTPLADIKSLKVIHISKVHSCDFSALENLRQLQWLGIGSKQIDNVALLAELPELRWLMINGNQVPQEEINALKEALPHCDLEFRK